MVGALSQKAEQAYGRLLAPLLRYPATLVIVSTDFCHWGTRFRYTPGLGSGDEAEDEDDDYNQQEE